jgi:hypothetical protein
MHQRGSLESLLLCQSPSGASAMMPIIFNQSPGRNDARSKVLDVHVLGLVPFPSGREG